jgi:hypothetical protein
LSVFVFSSAVTCASVKMRPSWATFASSAFRRCLIVVRSCRCQMQRTPPADTMIPRFASSLATRNLTPGRLLDREHDHRRLHLRRHAVL